MNFQKLKLSACGHELASSILFGKRIGFSGTPSNLLPLDMGDCEYEPGSDGKILNVLTDPAITSSDELPEGWTPLKVLHQIATANPPYHALIDTGALITNMDNEQVARYLIEFLPSSFEGVVFLDSRDKQVVLQRNNMQIVPLSQCGVALSRRFTFFDQVHTTGMDIKQSPTATAVVTIGKDMVFRDYAQGAFRMRGIGKGQRIKLFLIPEVVARVRESLIAYDSAAATNSNTINIPAWLLLNAMRIEGLQFVKLSQQELENIWRKLGLKYLLKDSTYANGNVSSFTDLERVRRFGQSHAPSAATGGASTTSATSNMSAARDVRRGPVPSDFLARCIDSFREAIGFPVPDHVEAPIGYAQKVTQHFDAKPHELLVGPVNPLDGTTVDVEGAMSGHVDPHAMSGSAMPTPDAQSVDRIEFVMKRMLNALDVHGKESEEMNLNAEVVHEQEAEEEQEQEAEQEEQRISAFTRDDEQQIGWDVRVIDAKNKKFASGTATNDTLNSTGVVGDSPFYPCAQFQVRPEQPMIAVPSYVTLSDNFYRKRWAGLGERRLRNCVVFVQWLLNGSSETYLDHTTQGAVITLAEAETLRWLLHHNNKVQSSVPIAIRIVGSGRYVEASSNFRRMMKEAVLPTTGNSEDGAIAFMPAAECRVDFLAMDATYTKPVVAAAASTVGEHNNTDNDNVSHTTSTVSSAAYATLTDPIALWFRFFNNDMFYTPDEIHTLATRILPNVSLPDRVAFFMECLRLRRRHRNDFEDAPIADLFTADEDRDELKDVAELKRLEVALLRFAKAASEDANGGKSSDGTTTTTSSKPPIDPAFMTEEEQLQHLLAESAAGLAVGGGGSGGSDGGKKSSFIAILRRTLRDTMNEALIMKATTTVSHSPLGPHLTPSETSSLLRNAMYTAVKESIAAAKSACADGMDTATTSSEASASVSSPSSGVVTTNVRLPSSLSSLDLDAAMARVEAMLLERALHEAAARAKSSQGAHTHSSASTNSHKITYEMLINILPVLHVEYEAIEESKLAAAKEKKKSAKAAAKAAKAASMAAAVPWNCPSCTFANPAHITNCSICYGPRPAEFAPSSPADDASPIGGDDSDDDDEEQLPVQWNCPACTFLNESAAIECGICNTPNPSPPKPKKGEKSGAGGAIAGGNGIWEREVPEGMWVCSVEHGGCSMYNPDNWYYCRACDKARPNLASLRF